MDEYQTIEECLSYFTSNQILKKSLDAMVKKYRSFGTACGTVDLRGLTREDIECLEGFTGKNYHGKKHTSISVSTFQHAIEISRYRGITLDQLLELYCGGNLKSRKQEMSEVDECLELFFQKLMFQYEHSPVAKWLSEIKEQKRRPFKILQKKYREKVYVDEIRISDSEESFRKEMQIFLESVNCLPKICDRFEYLPVFAAAVSGDPHYFDDGKEYTLLLLYAINDIFCLNQNISSEIAAEKKHQLLFEAGIIKDPLSNNAMVYGICAQNEEGEHPGIAGFAERKEAFSVPLATIIRLKSVTCINQVVFVVENPTVFALLAEAGDKSVICVNGQPNLAVLRLLDLIALSRETMYYSGDFDPEGLLIAQRLKDRYPDLLQFWHYEETDYLEAISEKTVSEKRIKMMEVLTSPELKQIAGLIREHKVAGYQEKIVVNC